MVEQLREVCRRLLDDVTVDVIVGYGRTVPDGPAHVVFVTEPDGVDQLVWDDRCYPNLTTYLTRPDVQTMGRPGVVVKGCDARSLVVLAQEAQVDRKQMYAVGVACDGVGEPKCERCDAHVPAHVDEVVGETTVSNAPADSRYAEVEAFLEKSPAERLAYWQTEFARCVKCYACRAVCPTCYCPRCIVDKNRPTVVDTSAHMAGNFGWHITRAFHQAGRCTGCGECTRNCPAGINLELLNASLRRSGETHFGVRAGTDPDTPPAIGSFSPKDREDFIH